MVVAMRRMRARVAPAARPNDNDAPQWTLAALSSAAAAAVRAAPRAPSGGGRGAADAREAVAVLRRRGCGRGGGRSAERNVRKSAVGRGALLLLRWNNHRGAAVARVAEAKWAGMLLLLLRADDAAAAGRTAIIIILPAAPPSAPAAYPSADGTHRCGRSEGSGARGQNPDWAKRGRRGGCRSPRTRNIKRW